MDIYRQIRSASRKFFAAYPKELADRLEWWAKVTDMDRVRFLRLLGLSAEEAVRRRDEDLKEILKDPKCQAYGQGVEWMLVNHISLDRYDWRGLVKTLQHYPDQATANGDDSEFLLRVIAGGGSGALPSLLAYLAASRVRSDRAES